MNKVLKGTLYNTIGMFVYLFSQWSMSILVVRLSGSYEEAGVLATAVSVCNVFYIISHFTIRNYQIADINDKFSNSEYFTHRIITCVMSLLILIVYLFAMQYSLYISLSVICYMLIKTAEAMVDVIHGAFQKEWRLDLACKSFVIRGIANIIVFSVMEYLTKNLIISLFSTATVSLVLAITFDFRVFRSMFDLTIDFKNKKVYKMFMCCFPIFAYGLLSALLYNSPRIMAQKICGEEMFGYYSSVAAPTIVIHVAINSIFSPCITLLSEQFLKREKKYFKTIITIQVVIIIISLIAIVGFKLLGELFLKTVFGEEILPYSYLLIPAVAGAALSVAAAFVSTLFTVMGHNTIMVILEGISLIVGLLLSAVLINRFELQGINYAIIASCAFCIILNYCFAIPIGLKHFRKTEVK